jgi:hypothetical protein
MADFKEQDKKNDLPRQDDYVSLISQRRIFEEFPL